MREISRSLGTASPRKAAQLAHDAWAVSERVFQAMREQPEAVGLIRKLLEETPGDSPTADGIEAEIRGGTGDVLSIVYSVTCAMAGTLSETAVSHLMQHLNRLHQVRVEMVAGVESQVAQSTQHLSDLQGAIAAAQSATRTRDAVEERLGSVVAKLDAEAGRISARITTLSAELDIEKRVTQRVLDGPRAAPPPALPAPEPVPVPPRAPAKAKKPLWSSQVAAFIQEKSRRVDGHEGYDRQTQRQTETTLRLWTDVLGDRPLDTYDGADAGAFRTLLLRLPSTHGKSSTRIAPLEAARTADERQRGIDTRNAALANDAPREPSVVRLSMKTVKRHFSTLSQFWVHQKRLGHVSGDNLFRGWEYQEVKRDAMKRTVWSVTDLMLMLTAQWMNGDTAWIVGIAMLSGMRIEEIFRLRPGTDIVERDGILCMHVQPQTVPSRWTPKSDAGSRLVPVHSWLLGAGFREMVESRRADARLFPGGPARASSEDLSARFVKDFSRRKSNLGIGADTTFHSFRHSVSTMLRNAASDVREPWIDALLGHSASSGSSQGVTSYLHGISAKNLKNTVEAVRYSPEVLEHLSANINK